MKARTPSALQCAIVACAASLLGCASQTEARRPLTCAVGQPCASTTARLAAAATDHECAPTDASRVTLGSLLHELSDLEHLTHAPSPAYTSLLASSFDRAAAAATPADAAWFANRDWLVLEPGVTAVLLDVAGPGALTRIWSANPSGTLRVYLDGASTPVIEADMKALLSGEVEPFGEPYAFATQGGYNFYFPIPFAEHCRVTVSSDAARLFFQIDHRRYEGTAQLESFSQAALEAAACARRVTHERLALPDSAVPQALARETFTLTSADSGGSERSFTATDGAELRELRVQIADDVPDHLLRETILSIRVDGEQTVRAPLGDFFGAGPGLHLVRSFPSDVTPQTRTLVARWPMPFRRELKLRLFAASDTTLRASFQTALAMRPFTSDTRLFYARWHPPDTQPSEPTHDWNAITIHGDGVYVGNVLNLINNRTSWWGEGDEKIYVDGEAFPSHFGTGTEDYYGYGFCSNVVFTTPFVGQTHADPHRNYGAVSLYRFHLLDAIPFRSSFRFDFEVNHWGKTPSDMLYDTTQFFYAKPGARAAPSASTPEQYRVPLPMQPVPDDVTAGPYRCGGG